MILAAFGASWLACFCLGWLVRGWLENERHPTIPEHPSLRRTRERPRLHVIDGGAAPYNWAEEQ